MPSLLLPCACRFWADEDDVDALQPRRGMDSQKRPSTPIAVSETTGGGFYWTEAEEKVRALDDISQPFCLVESVC